MYLQRNSQILHFHSFFSFFFFNFLAPCLISPTVAHRTFWWFNQMVDIVGSTVFHKNTIRAFATIRTITKADFPGNNTISQRWMLEAFTQPAWEVCTTVVWFHTRYWHFCSSSSHKTIPSLNEHIVTQRTIGRCRVTFFSVKLCQISVVVTTIG